MEPIHSKCDNPIKEDDLTNELHEFICDSLALIVPGFDAVSYLLNPETGTEIWVLVFCDLRLVTEEVQRQVAALNIHAIFEQHPIPKWSERDCNCGKH